MKNYFFNPTTDAVHPPHPLHLVFGLELFRYTLASGVLLHQQIEHIVGRAVDFLQVSVQPAAEEQSDVYTFVVLLLVVFPPHAPYSDSWSLRRDQFRQQVLALTMVSQFVHQHSIMLLTSQIVVLLFFVYCGAKKRAA